MTESNKPTETMPEGTGRALWRLLHAWARGYAVTPDVVAIEEGRKWLGQFRQAVAEASGQGCPCADYWGDITAAWPPPLKEGRRAMQQWTELMHDLVNVKLGKARYTQRPHEAFGMSEGARLWQAKQRAAREAFLERQKLLATQPNKKGD
jgi:hypothetical protein